MVIETTDATTGEVTEVTQNEMGLTVVYEDWDTMGNYVVYLEDAGTGDRIMEVYDSMGGVEVTIIHADGSTETTKTDEMGNMITDAYYDEWGNYIETKFDNALGCEVTITTDPWGWRTEEYIDPFTGVTVFREFDPTGWEIIRLPTATAP